MKPRQLSILAGVSYLVIFFAAIFGNFFVLEAILSSPVETVTQNHLMVRFGILAFLLTIIFICNTQWFTFHKFCFTPPLFDTQERFR